MTPRTQLFLQRLLLQPRCAAAQRQRHLHLRQLHAPPAPYLCNTLLPLCIFVTLQLRQLHVLLHRQPRRRVRSHSEGVRGGCAVCCLPLPVQDQRARVRCCSTAALPSLYLCNTLPHVPCARRKREQRVCRSRPRPRRVALHIRSLSCPPSASHIASPTNINQTRPRRIASPFTLTPLAHTHTRPPPPGPHGTHFSLSLKRLRRTSKGKGDLTKIAGIDGVCVQHPKPFNFATEIQ